MGNFDIRLIGLLSSLNGVKVSLLLDNSSLNHSQKEHWINEVKNILLRFDNFSIATMGQNSLNEKAKTVVKLKKEAFKRFLVDFIDSITIEIDMLYSKIQKEKENLIGFLEEDEVVFELKSKEISNLLENNFKLDQLESLKNNGYTLDTIITLISTDLKENMNDYIYRFIVDLLG